jgi:hypothetical protein
MFGNAKMHRSGIRKRFDLDGLKRRHYCISQLDVPIHKAHENILQVAGELVKGISPEFCSR